MNHNKRSFMKNDILNNLLCTGFLKGWVYCFILKFIAHVLLLLIFKYCLWRHRSKDDGEVVREIPASGSGVRKVAELVRYRVSVQTGDVRGGGTDAEVFLCLHGNRGDTGHRKLLKSSTHSNKFERGKVCFFNYRTTVLVF